MPQNLFAASRTDDGLISKRIPVNSEVQQALESLFVEQERSFFEGITEEVEFDGSWKPEINEVLTLDIPDEANAILNAISNNPISVPTINTANFVDENIRALFTNFMDGNSSKILVQRFTPQQILTKKFSLLQDGNTFGKIIEPAFSLDLKLVCVIQDNKLKFKSFHNLRTIFSLLETYREATDQEVLGFCNHSNIAVVDSEQFKENADQTIRKLIHAIVRAETLNNNSARQIQQRARQNGISIRISDGKLVFPEERAEVKKLLYFLDDGLYVGPISQQRYITNSKRPI